MGTCWALNNTRYRRWMANIFSEPATQACGRLRYISVASVLLAVLGNMWFCCKFYTSPCTSLCLSIYPWLAPDTNSCFLHTGHLEPSLHSFYVRFRRNVWTSTFPWKHRHGISRPLLRELFWTSRGKGWYLVVCSGCVDRVFWVHRHVLLEGECGTKWSAVRCSENKVCKVHYIIKLSLYDLIKLLSNSKKKWNNVILSLIVRV